MADTDPIEAAFSAAKASAPDPIEDAFRAAKSPTEPFTGPIQPDEPTTLSAHGITDPASVSVTNPPERNPKTGRPIQTIPYGQGILDLPVAEGIARAAKAAKVVVPAVLGLSDPGRQAGLDAAHQLVTGVFQATTPIQVGLVAAAGPVEGGWALLKAYLAQKVGEKAADALGADPQVKALAGDLGAVVSGTLSAVDILTDAKRAGRAMSLAAKLSGSGMGTTDIGVPGMRGAPVVEEPFVERASREASQQRSVSESQAAQDAVDEARQHQPPQGQRAPQVTPVEQVPTDVHAAYEQAKRVTDQRGGRTADQIAALPQGPTNQWTQDEQGRPVPTVAVPPPPDLQPAVEAAAIGHPYQASTEAIQAEQEAGSASVPRGVSEEKPSYGSTQVQLPPETAKKVTAFAQAIPDDQLAEHGRETDPHVTVKYGLHTDNVDEVRKVLAGVAPITVRLGATSVFPDTGNGDVLKVDVDSPDLHALNAKIAGALETTDTHPGYSPHATIAYLKPGAGAQYAGRKDFAGDTMTVDHVVFSLPDDSKVSIPLTGQQGEADTLAAYTAAKGVESPHGEVATPPLTDGANRPSVERSGAVESGSGHSDAARPRVPAEPFERFVKRPASEHAHRFTPEVTRELTRLAEELSTFPHVPRTWQDLSHEHGLRGNASGGHAQITGAVSGAEAYRDILSQSPVNAVTSGRRKGELAKEPGGSQAKILHAVKRVLASKDITNNLMEGAVKVAELRAAGDYRVIKPPALPPSWGTVSPAVEAALEAAYDAPSDADAWEEALHKLQDEEASGDIDFDPETLEGQPRLPEAGSVREQEHATPQFEAPFSLSGEVEERTAVEPDLFGNEKPTFSARSEPAPIFYSALTRAAEGLKQHRGTPEQMAAMLEKAPGVRKEELEWSGVKQWLSEIATDSKSVPDSVARHADRLRDFASTDAFRAHGLGGLNIPTQTAVLKEMFAAAHNSEIREAIIGAVPVDVMDVLRARKLTPERLFDKVTVFLNLFPITANADVAIPVDVATAMVKAGALAAAEVVGESSHLPRPMEGHDTTNLAGDQRHSSSLQRGVVTKAAIVDYLQKNELQVTETMRGDEPPQVVTDASYTIRPSSVRSGRFVFVDSAGNVQGESNTEEMARQNAEEWADAVRRGQVKDYQEKYKPTKFSAHTLPGGSHYRELLIQLPTLQKPGAVDMAKRKAVFDEWQPEIDHLRKVFDGLPATGAYLDRIEAERNIVEAMQKRDAEADRVGGSNRQEQFLGGHFDEPNIVAHVRFDDRTDADGKRVLFIQEVQSDLHQKGRKHGYKSEKDGRLIDGHDATWWGEEADRRFNLRSRPSDGDYEGAEARWQEAIGNRNALIGKPDEVPDAPFKTTWQELAARRMVRYAAEHGYDRIAWTTGSQQAERYDLSKHISKVEYTPAKKGADLTVGRLTAFDHKGDRVIDQMVKPEDLPDYIGKDAADKLLATPHTREELGGGIALVGPHTLSGLDLKVGGEGMKGFYDKILPAYLNKFGKPFGARVGETRIDVQGRASAREGLGVKYEYVGPILSAEELTRRANRDMNDTSATAVGSTIAGQFRDMAASIDRGSSFREAMERHGSIAAAEAVGGKLHERANVLASVHMLPITDPMRQTALEGLPLFAEAITPRGIGSTDRDFLRQTYRDMRSVPMGDRSVVVFDAGSRFSPEEIAALTQNPAVQRIAEASLDVLDQVLDQVVGKDKAGVERTGLVLMQDIFGVYVPKPGAARGQQQRATILLNPFEAMIGPGQSVVAPSEAAKMAYYTAVHEALHWHVPFDGPDFDAQLHALLDTLGDEFRDTSTARIMETYADPDQPRKYRAGVLDLLQTYQGTRRRPAVARDALSDARGGEARFADRTDRESPAPRDLRSGRARTVTEQQLRTLAARAGTSVAKQREEAEKRGYTVYSTVLPGAEKLEPAVEKIAQALRNDTGLLLSLIGPAHVGVAPMAAGSARAYTAARDQQLLRVQKELAATKRVMDSWSKEKVKLFWRVMEGQEPAQSLPRSDRQYAQTLGAVLKRWTDLIVELGLIEDYLEHYFPHEWVKGSVEGDLLRRLFGRRPMQGSEAFRKHRSIPTMEEGLKIGLEPVSWNPADQVFRKVAEMARSVRARGFRDDMKRMGLYAYVAAGKTKPEAIRDWQRVPDEALGTVYGARVPEQAYGQVIAGHYYAPREVVRLVENMISRGLHGRSVILDGFNQVGNASTAMLLGWTARHVWLTGLEWAVSKFSLGIEEASRGEIGEAAKSFAQVLGPQAAVFIARDIVKGYKDIKEFYGRDATANATAGFVGQVIQGGGGFGQPLFDQTDAPRKFATNIRQLFGALRDGEIKAAAKSGSKAFFFGALTAAEGPTILAMKYWVPALKASAFHDLAEMELRRLGPDATLEDQRKVYGKAWDSVDNRFGQLRYDNLFWNNTFKQILMSMFLSVSWQVGSLREGGGAFGQIPLTARKLKAAIEGAGGEPPKIGEEPPRKVGKGKTPAAAQGYVEPWVNRQFAWMIALMTLVITADAIKQYLTIGKRLGELPDGTTDWKLALRDAFAPRNGRIGPSGREERDTPISYAKDFYSWTHHPVTTTEHKLKSIWHLLADLVENEDFYGDAIYDGDDPLGTIAKDAILYTLKGSLPISYQHAKQRLAEGATLKQALIEMAKEGASPFEPASAELERSDLEQYLHDLIPPSHRTKADAAKAAARRSMREEIRQGDPAAAHDTAQAAGLSKRSEQAVRRSERVGALQSAFDRVTWPEAVKAMDLATDTERASLRGPFLRKALRALQATRSSEERARIQQQRNTALKQPQPTS